MTSGSSSYPNADVIVIAVSPTTLLSSSRYVCEVCSKAYGVESDLKVHSKGCVWKSYLCQLCGSRFKWDNFTAHQEHCVTRKHVGAVTSTTNNSSNIPVGSVFSHPQTLGMRDNTFRINSNESSSTQIGPHQISYIQNQSNYYYPFTTPCQSELSQPQQQLHNLNVQGDLGNIHGGYMLDPSNSFNLTPARHNLGLNEILNPVTGSSDAESYEQGGYMGYPLAMDP